jgi:hypothetical protein
MMVLLPAVFNCLTFDEPVSAKPGPIAAGWQILCQNFGGSGNVKLATISIRPRITTGTIHDQALL